MRKVAAKKISDIDRELDGEISEIVCHKRIPIVPKIAMYIIPSPCIYCIGVRHELRKSPNKTYETVEIRYENVEMDEE